MPTSPLPPPQAGLQRSRSLVACDEALRACADGGQPDSPEVSRAVDHHVDQFLQPSTDYQRTLHRGERLMQRLCQAAPTHVLAFPAVWRRLTDRLSKTVPTFGPARVLARNNKDIISRNIDRMEQSILLQAERGTPGQDEKVRQAKVASARRAMAQGRKLLRELDDIPSITAVFSARGVTVDELEAIRAVLSDPGYMRLMAVAQSCTSQYFVACHEVSERIVELSAQDAPVDLDQLRRRLGIPTQASTSEADGARGKEICKLLDQERTLKWRSALFCQELGLSPKKSAKVSANLTTLALEFLSQNLVRPSEGLDLERLKDLVGNPHAVRYMSKQLELNELRARELSAFFTQFSQAWCQQSWQHLDLDGRRAISQTTEDLSARLSQARLDPPAEAHDAA